MSNENLAATGTASPSMTPGIAGTDTPKIVAVDETDRLIASDKVAGAAVYGRDNEHLGSIHNFMVDKVSGRVDYVVLSFGSFLGLGGRYYPLPWKSLAYAPERGGYVVNLGRKDIENAPSFGEGEQPWSDPAYGPRVYGFYGAEYGGI